MNIKDIFKNKNTMSTDNKDKEILENEMNLNTEAAATDETVLGNENEGVEEDALSTEQKLELELSNEKDKFLRLFAEFENYKKKNL